jgi:hypothetical protein
MFITQTGTPGEKKGNEPLFDPAPLQRVKHYLYTGFCSHRLQKQERGYGNSSRPAMLTIVKEL